MAGGGGFQDVSIDDMNTKISQITPPSREENPMLYEDDQFGNSRLDAWYSNEVSKVARSMQPQDPQELTRNVTDAVIRANAQGRLPDPDYDILAKQGVDYGKIEWSPSNISALAAQRASDYLSDRMAKASAQSRKLSQAQQELLLAQRTELEKTRLTTAAAGDQAARDQARQARLTKLIKGSVKFPAGSSLLALDDPENEYKAT
ncbi:MAG: hypothetical protein HY795_05860 [Desulfovibrio sp.]|nr:hypothetical protein [Desulfovibrio sp.]MBI4961358.1 hypothetical protein [Desulfovibrio sp.]